VPVLKPMISYYVHTRFLSRHQTRSYYRATNLVNDSLSLAIGFKTGNFSSLKKIRLYRNMSEICR